MSFTQRRLRPFIFLALAALAVAGARAALVATPHVSTITGRVTDSNGTPLANVTVHVAEYTEGHEFGVATDLDALDSFGKSYAALSRPAYSDDGHAFVFARYRCGPRCGYEWTFLLENADGVWRVLSRRMIGIR